MFQNVSPMMSGYSPSYIPGGFSQFSATGVPGMNGGYAYPPGSAMTQFMDSINNTVAIATAGPGGGSIVDWARSLAAGQNQSAGVGPQSAASGGGMGGLLTQIVTMLMQIISAKAQQRSA